MLIPYHVRECRKLSGATKGSRYVGGREGVRAGAFVSVLAYVALEALSNLYSYGVDGGSAKFW